MSTRRARQRSDTTPPGSFAKKPLTPPPSEQKSGTTGEKIIQDIEHRQSGRDYLTSHWQRYKLSPAEYNYVEQRLRTVDKVRFDYFPSASLFVLRMPSVLHEAFKSSIVDDIVQQLRSIAKGNGPASEFARRIKHGGSATITFSESGYGRHEPDDLFRYHQAQFPNVVLEISFSQKKRDLARLADKYILGSDGNIRVVVGIDIDYKDKSATLSMWRSRLQVNNAGEEELVAHRALSNQEFRTANGETSSQTGLRLQLDDFIPAALLPMDTKLDKDIFISSADLCAYLRDAEDIGSTIKQGVGFAEPLKPGVKKRPLSSSSIEELNTDDESRVQQKEERAAKRSQRDDRGYGGS